MGGCCGCQVGSRTATGSSMRHDALAQACTAAATKMARTCSGAEIGRMTDFATRERVTTGTLVMGSLPLPAGVVCESRYSICDPKCCASSAPVPAHTVHISVLIIHIIRAHTRRAVTTPASKPLLQTRAHQMTVGMPAVRSQSARRCSHRRHCCCCCCCSRPLCQATAATAATSTAGAAAQAPALAPPCRGHAAAQRRAGSHVVMRAGSRHICASSLLGAQPAVD